MDNTITGKTTDVLEQEIFDLYESYIAEEQGKIISEHKDKTDSFSRIIMIYKEKVDLSIGKIKTNPMDFYRNFMSIKVIQLIYRTWKNPEDSDYKYEELEDLQVIPGVFSPNFASDSYLWAEYMKEKGLVPNKDILEMGAGSGIISLYLYKYANPKTVTAVDISAKAIENLEKNSVNFNVDRSRFNIVHSNLFDNIDQNSRFDVIFWAYVWLKIEDEEIKKIIEEEDDQEIKNLLFSVSDIEYKMLDRFIMEAKQHLRESGSIFLITSDFLPNSDIKEIAEKYNLKFSIEKFTNKTDVVKSAKMILDLYNITLSL